MRTEGTRKVISEDWIPANNSSIVIFIIDLQNFEFIFTLYGDACLVFDFEYIQNICVVYILGIYSPCD